MKTIKIIIPLLLTLFFLFGCSSETQEDKKVINETENKKTILALGDSITAGYSLELEDSYPSQLESLLKDKGYNYKLINAGVSGDTSKQLLERIDLYLENENLPETAILVIGGNDGLRGQDIDDLSENIKKIIDKLRSKNITVVLGGMQIPPNLGLKYSNDFKKSYKIISKEKDVYLIDFFLDGVAGYKTLNLNDGIHPNKQGYKIIAENVFNFLQSNNLIKND